VHLAAVRGFSVVRSGKLVDQDKDPTTLCGEHKRMSVRFDGEISCERCIRILAKRPQLYNALQAEAVKEQAAP
jgi:hypothetical protein